MAQIKSKQELEKLSKRELFKYIEDITQTDICKNEDYCKLLTSLILKA